MSAGVIEATGCSSRFPLIVAGLGLVACAFFPSFIFLLEGIPSPVMGALLLYLMSGQLASGLEMLVAERGIRDFNSGLTVALPLMIGLLVTFAPTRFLASCPALLRPLAGNGFIMGTLAVVLLEHVVLRGKR